MIPRTAIEVDTGRIRSRAGVGLGPRAGVPRVPAPSMVQQAGSEICADGMGWERRRRGLEIERCVVDESR